MFNLRERITGWAFEFRNEGSVDFHGNGGDHDYMFKEGDSEYQCWVQILGERYSIGNFVTSIGGKRISNEKVLNSYWISRFTIIRCLVSICAFSLLAELSFAQDSESPPYSDSSIVERFELDWSTHKRFAQGSDNFQLTWAKDGHLYGAWGDGGGFGGTNSRGRVGLGIARIEGEADDYRGYNVWGGFEPNRPASFDGKSWGMIGVIEELFMWLVPDHPEGKSYRNHYEYAQLVRSNDSGRSWVKADWHFLQSEGLTIPTFLNFGKDNAGVPASFGDYIYSYFIRPENHTMEHQGPKGVGLVVHQPGVLYLARVRASELMESKSRYEFFRGFDDSGQPLWGSIGEKRPVFEDSNGAGWCLSASYNPEFDRVILATQHSENASGMLGFFDAPTPWGPWTTIEYFGNDAPFGEIRMGSELAWRNNVFFAAFATKWLDGERFVLNFTGGGNGKDNDSFNTVEGRFVRAGEN